jgi:WD40 repeat protein
MKTMVKPIAGHTLGPVNSVAFPPDGRTLVSAQGNLLRLWDVASSRLVRDIVDHDYVGESSSSSSIDVRSVAFPTAAARRALSGSNDDTLKLWDVASGRLLSTFTPPGNWSVNAVAFSPDGASVVSAQQDSTVRLWDVATRRLLKTFTGLQDGATAVAFSPDGRTVGGGQRGARRRAADDVGRGKRRGDELPTGCAVGGRIGASRCGPSP